MSTAKNYYLLIETINNLPKISFKGDQNMHTATVKAVLSDSS